MLRLTLRNVADRPIRFLLTAAAVVLGVAFVVGTFITTDNLRERFDQLTLDIVGPEPDLAVRTVLAGGDDAAFAPRLPLPASALEVIETVPGVDQVQGRIEAAGVTAFAADGRVVDNGPAPQFGRAFTGSDLDTLFLQPGGRLPSDRGSIDDPGFVGEFVVDVDVADEYDFRIGETYTVASEVGNRPFTLVGLVTFGAPDEHKTAGATFMGFAEETAQEFLGRPGAFDYAVVRTTPEADVATVMAAITDALAAEQDVVIEQYVESLLGSVPPGGVDPAALEQLSSVRIETLTSTELSDELRGQFGEVLSVFENVLLAFAIIGVVVSAFIINNTFNIILGQRIRELGLLRAVGASATQIRGAVIGEAVAVGAVATTLGLLGGVGLAFVLRAGLVALDFDAPNRYPISWMTVAVAVVLGMGVTVAASVAPAWRAGRVPPMAALREDLRLPAASMRRRLIAGSVVVGLGLALLTLAVLLDVRLLWQISCIAGGALALFIGVYLLSPFAAPTAARVLGGRIPGAAAIVVGALLTVVGVGGALAVAVAVATEAGGLGGVALGALLAAVVALVVGGPGLMLVSSGLAPFRLSGRLARETAAGNPRRTASAAAALTIGLALVSTAAVVSDSVRATFVATLDESIDADYFVFTSTFDPGAGVSAEASSRVAALTEGPDAILESALAYRFAPDGVVVDGDPKDVLGAELSLLDQHIDPQISAGSLADAGPESILLHRDPAADLDVGVGAPVAVTFAGGQQATLTVAAIYDDSTVLGNWTIDISQFDSFLPTVPDGFITANVAAGVAFEEARAALETALADFPSVSVQDREEFRETQEERLTLILAIVIVFVLLSLVIAVLGIAITMALAVFERTRELGLLRAVGMTREQARRMISWEAVIVSLFGGVLGVVIGTGFGLAVALVLPETFIDVISIPWSVLAGSLMAAAVFGVVAALFPAYRAGRLDVLEAIGHE